MIPQEIRDLATILDRRVAVTQEEDGRYTAEIYFPAWGDGLHDLEFGSVQPTEAECHSVLLEILAAKANERRRVIQLAVKRASDVVVAAATRRSA